MSENEPIRNGSESVPAATEAVEAEQICASADENEETPVIDVHAPHGGVHTWKDFWIHLGTIAAGLLIAISLEQGVEALHRLHERHQLEADLQREQSMSCRTGMRTTLPCRLAGNEVFP